MTVPSRSSPGYCHNVLYIILLATLMAVAEGRNSCQDDRTMSKGGQECGNLTKWT